MSNKIFSSRVEINLYAIRNNVLKVHELTGMPIAAVVKGDAYGHGIVQTARAAIEAGSVFLTVARSDEALVLRNAGVTAPVLVMGMIPPEDLIECVSLDISGTLFSYEQMQMYRELLPVSGKKLKVHAKIDTGMGRLGIPAEEGMEFVRAIINEPNLELEGMFTHMACGDEPQKPTTDIQIDRYERLLDEMASEGIKPRYIHASNSTAALFNKRLRKYDFVRTGFAMFGINPSNDASLPEGFIPALTWKTGLISIRTFPAGTGISYSHLYHTQKDNERIGVIPLGYGDGVHRMIGNEVLIRGKRVPVLGTVCMDLCMISLEDVPDAELGDEVIFIGKQLGDEIKADDVARRWGVTNYEVTTGITKRIRRYYVDFPVEN